MIFTFKQKNQTRKRETWRGWRIDTRFMVQMACFAAQLLIGTENLLPHKTILAADTSEEHTKTTTVKKKKQMMQMNC